MRYGFRILNVFTTTSSHLVENDRLSGNPLAVFEDARGLSDAQMQALARQMNLSETTFILPSETSTAHVRIFTPSYEMPFAGHPTLGTAHVVRALRGGDAVSLAMKAGVVEVTAQGDAWTLRAARAPATREPAATRAELATMVGLPVDAIGARPLWVNTGVEQLVLPVRSADLVRAAKPDPTLLVKHGFGDGEAMAYVWAPDRDDSFDTITVRFFFTQHGAVIEDPATGSACANLGGWFLATGHAPLPLRTTLRQGDAVQRPSQLGLHVDAEQRIFVTGSVIELGRGVLDL
jgi:trans-2,3-dihydro-3-hydroxyanthranilate isomerase